MLAHAVSRLARASCHAHAKHVRAADPFSCLPVTYHRSCACCCQVPARPHLYAPRASGPLRIRMAELRRSAYLVVGQGQRIMRIGVICRQTGISSLYEHPVRNRRSCAGPPIWLLHGNGRFVVFRCGASIPACPETPTLASKDACATQRVAALSKLAYRRQSGLRPQPGRGRPSPSVAPIRLFT